MRRNQQHRDIRISPALISLFVQLFQALSPSKPPITIALVVINVIAYLHPNPYVLGYSLADIQGNCIHPQKVLVAFFSKGQFLWNRVFLSSIIHADDMHLYYNMLSLSWKGVHLERTLGSQGFLFLVLFSLITSHLLMILISYILFTFCNFSGYDSGLTVCAVGFSAVLFSLKTVWNILSPEMSNIMGVSIPSRYACWLELIVISLITPNASFIGHLAGILAGCLYLIFFHSHVSNVFWLPIPMFIRNIWRGLFGGQRYIYRHGRPDGQNDNTTATEDTEEIELEYIEEIYEEPVRHPPHAQQQQAESQQQRQQLDQEALRRAREARYAQQELQQARFRGGVSNQNRR